MADHKSIDPGFKARVREALRTFELGSANRNEDLAYLGDSAPPQQLEALLIGIDERLKDQVSFTVVREGLIADLAEAIRCKAPDLQDVGDSDPEAAAAFLQREAHASKTSHQQDEAQTVQG